MLSLSLKGLIFFCFFLIICPWLYAGAIDELTTLVKKMPKAAIFLANEEGEIIFSRQNGKQYVPASLQKVSLALAVLDTLNSNYRFQTHFLITSKNDLIIRGYGDPFLISEEINFIAQHLRNSGYRSFRSLYLDDSSFKSITVPGLSNSQRTYDALNGALAINFNTIYLQKDHAGKLSSAEPQTPLTSLALKKGALISAGTKKRINLGNKYDEILLYTQQIFTTLFHKTGITIIDKAFKQEKNVLPEKLIYIHKNSRQLTELTKGMLLYSNNFIANQLALTLGASQKGYPIDLTVSMLVIQAILVRSANIKNEDFNMVEGSGISRQNFIRPKAMMNIFEAFKKYSSLIPKMSETVYAKSGTLKGVYNYGGYFKTAQGLRSFIIITHSKQNHRDRLLFLLEKISENL